jgi:hypothetical protein
MPETNNPGYRYPGTRPFNAEDSHIFMGRGEDIESLVQKMHIQKLLVLYSRSGLGKSSLINARLTAGLSAEQGVLPVVIRLGAYVKGAVSPFEKFIEILNTRFPQASESVLYSQLFKGEPPSSHILWYLVKSIQLNDPQHQAFVFIFDQFEELFTYPAEMVKEFGRALSEMFFVSVPQQLRTKLSAILNVGADMPEETRKLLAAPVIIKMLMAIRSDKMSLLNNLAAFFPSILQNCYELRALNREQATEAIMEPASLPGNFASPAFTFTPAAINLILDGLTKIYDETAPGTQAEIETFQLQIVCKYAENLVISKNIKLIDAPDLGEINTIFENHYRNIIAALSPGERLPARKLLEEKLIVDGIRISMPKVSILKEPGMTEQLLNELVGTHILRPEQDNYFEIAHDTLVLPIMRYYDERKLEELKANELMQLEEKTRREKAALEKELADQASRNRRRKRRIQSIALLSILGCLGIFTVVLLRQNNAIKKRGMAFSMMSRALFGAAKDPSKALNLAYKALENSDDTVIVNGAFFLLVTNVFYATTIHVSNQSYIRILQDESTVLSSSPTGDDTLWTVEGKPLQTFKTPNKISAVGISKDGNWLVYGDVRGQVGLYNIKSKKRLDKLITNESFKITTARFSRDGKYVLIRSEEPVGEKAGVIKILDLAGTVVANLDNGVCAEYSADGRYVFVGTNDGKLIVYSNKGVQLNAVDLYNGSIQTIASSDDLLVACSWNGIISYWQRNDGNFEKIGSPHSINNEDACQAAWIDPNVRADDETKADEDVLITGTMGKGMVNSWAYENYELTKSLSFQGLGTTNSISVNNKTSEVFTCSNAGYVVKWTSGMTVLDESLRKITPLKRFFEEIEQISHEEKLKYLKLFFKQTFPDSADVKISGH